MFKFKSGGVEPKCFPVEVAEFTVKIHIKELFIDSILQTLFSNVGSYLFNDKCKTSTL